MKKVAKFAGVFPAFRIAVIAAIGLTIVPWSKGQSADNAANTQAPAAGTNDQVSAPGALPADQMEQQVVRMNPFTVTTGTEGYQAVDTLGGARPGEAVRYSVGDSGRYEGTLGQLGCHRCAAAPPIYD
jgi:hypothetical protein